MLNKLILDCRTEMKELKKDNNLLLNDLIIGSGTYEELEEKLQLTWSSDVQMRSIAAVVQAYGSGKTKCLIELGNLDCFDFVIPIRILKKKNSVLRLEAEIQSIFPSDFTYENILRFHNRSVEIFKTWIYSHIELTIKITKDLDNSKSNQRASMVYLLTSRHFSSAVSLQFEANLKLKNFIDNFEKEIRGLRIVVGFDEIHEFIGLKSGFFLHRCDLNILQSEQDRVINYWKDEQNGIPRPNKEFCTDLFYIFRTILVDVLRSEYPAFGTIMNSTLFRIWQNLELSQSLLSRDTFYKYSDLPVCNEDDVWNTIKYYYKDIPGNRVDYELFFNDWIGRPLFLLEFLIKPLCKARPRSISKVKSKFTDCFFEALKHAKARIQSRKSENLIINTIETANGYLILLLYAVQCCNSILNIVEDEVTYRIVSAGFAQLTKHNNGFLIVDTIYKKAILEFASQLDEDYVYVYLSRIQNNIHIVEKLGHPTKGYICERMVGQFLKKYFKEVCVGHEHLVKTMATYEEYFPDMVVEDYLNAFFDHSSKMVYPGTLMGPNILFSTINKSVVLVHSNCKGQYYTWSSFCSALDSLKLESAFTNQQLNCIRIVFSFSGFAKSIWFKVSEYNKKYLENPIILLDAKLLRQIDKKINNLLDILGQSFASSQTQDKYYQKLENDATLDLKKLNRYKIEQLKDFASERDIPIDKKRKSQLAYDIYHDIQKWHNFPDEYFSKLIVQKKRSKS
eukprot:NODE_208_length_12861_cov_0.800972.p1 type:complete len:735 gc:universal NODE_208_length_12861_cov_0.800972:8496-6292(-)